MFEIFIISVFSMPFLFKSYLQVSQGGYAFSGVGLQTNLQGHEQIFMKFSSDVHNGTRDRCFDFDDDPDHHLDKSLGY